MATGYRTSVIATLEPPNQVLAAFGVAKDPVEKLDGGRGLTWRAGSVVLRPAGEEREATWRAQVLQNLDHHEGFRTARPVKSVSGDWVVDGWEGCRWMPGAADETRIREVLLAGAAFHRAIAGLPRPALLDTSDHPWAQADRMTWDERLPAVLTLTDLAARFRPVVSPAQLIHGDLLGNVLFAEGQAPTVIDWAPYWRPAGYGSAIAVVDAMVWHGTPVESAVELGRGISEWEQLLVRAMAFRVATLHVMGAWDAVAADRHARVVSAITALSR